MGLKMKPIEFLYKKGFVIKHLRKRYSLRIDELIRLLDEYYKLKEK
jgi:hypothetical protein